MIYYFYGNSQKLIDDKIKAWQDKFIKDYGDFNLNKISNLEEIDKNYLIELLTSRSFLSQKKLIIIKLNNSKNEDEIVNFILGYTSNFLEENFILFYNYNTDKRSSKHKLIIKNSTNNTEFNSSNDFKDFNTNNLDQIIKKIYNNKISSDAIYTIIKYKGNNLGKIQQELDKLLINTDFIEKKDIIDNIYPELEENIFQITKYILSMQTKNLIESINILLTNDNIYMFYNSLISNLRISIYIMKLKEIGSLGNEISNILNLGKRSFLVNVNNKITYNKLKKIYLELIDLDKKMKTGKFLFSQNDFFQLQIEKILITNLNN